MKLEEIIPAYRKGKKIRRECWNEEKVMNLCIVKGIGKYGWVKEGVFWKAVTDALLKADDWEIVKEPKKVKLRDLTEEQYDLWIKNNCTKKYNDYCTGCPFQKVKCDNYGTVNDAWYLNKDLYSDKFLDQEIEVEE